MTYEVSRDPYYARRRVRLDGVAVEVFPDSRYRCTVTLSWLERESFRGVADAPDTQQGRLWAGAEASVRAQAEATQDRLRLHLGGVKAVRAFDVWIVIAQVRAESHEQTYRLIGSVDIPAEAVAHGAAMAALDATNRILEKYLPAETG